MTTKFIIGLATLYSLNSFSALPTGYVQMNAQDKQQVLWNNIEAKKYSKLPPIPNGGWGDILLKLKSMLTMNLSFDHTSDEMPAERGRNKIIHSSGSVAKIAFIPTVDTPFTGVFKTGADGLARLSLAANPDAVGSFTPGMGFKLLIDGKPSVNVMAMYSLDGQDQNKNFFANTFSNRIAEPKGFALKLLKLWFGLFAADPLVLGVDHFAAVEKDGRLVANPVVPYQLLFVPTKDVQLSATSTADFRSNLATIKSGSYMYIVKAKRSKNDIPFVIGYVKLMSDLVPSEYGDHQLFFQHRE